MQCFAVCHILHAVPCMVMCNACLCMHVLSCDSKKMFNSCGNSL
jgi:hypothetical protein